jgi:signal transduction histidine kinase
LQHLGTDISKAIIASSVYAMVAIMSLNDNHDDHLNFQGWAMGQGLEQKKPIAGVLKQLYGLRLPVDSEWIGSRQRNLIIDLSNQIEINNIGKIHPHLLPIFKLLKEEYDMKSLYFTKLKAKGSLTGMMVVGLEDAMPHLDDIALIERLGEPTGIALFNRLLSDENLIVLEQLKQTNEKLKEIDEAKDEFISMASHQLRTPLTSMKGYVSMVLDGDAGKVSESQRTLLQQAFNSSQRMVYLIADLLNVSRLRTGKFVITNKQVEMPSMVESELSQLTESAAARGVKFFYEKPKSFPLVMLDEMKIRQVVMNYLDNALYYTPKGGRVYVELKANNDIIDFTVTDTGLGVPKEDQRYLFTKFFRAQNARQMRPDGTGLGLYMTRKIISAQGGTILFSSVEGEGSTFGFRFPRPAIEVQQ